MSMFKRVTPIVDAIQYKGDLAEAKKFLGIRNAQYDTETKEIIYKKPSGRKEVISKGDWIIREPTGVIIVSNAEFVQSFEPIYLEASK